MTAKAKIIQFVHLNHPDRHNQMPF